MPLPRSKLELPTATELDRNRILTRQDVHQGLKQKEQEYKGQTTNNEVFSDLAKEMILMNNCFKTEVASEKWNIIRMIRVLPDNMRTWIRHYHRPSIKETVDKELPIVMPIMLREKVPPNYMPLFNDQYYGERRKRFSSFRPDPFLKQRQNTKILQTCLKQVCLTWR